MDLSEKMSLGEKGVWISILSYIMLSIIKVTIGYYYHSEALYADGLNNTTDIIASIAVIIGLRISRRPADHNHRYGHYRAETVAALLASFIMMTVGLFVLYRAVNSYFIGEIVKPDLLTAIVAIASAGVMGFVYVYNIRLAAKSIAVHSKQWHWIIVQMLLLVLVLLSVSLGHSLAGRGSTLLQHLVLE